MWSEFTWPGFLLWLGGAGIAAGAIGCLNGARLRVTLIWALALLPVWGLALALLLTGDIADLLYVLLMSLLISAPWAVVTIASYGLIRVIRRTLSAL